MSATASPSTYSAKKRILYGLTTGGLLLSGFGMATAQADTSAAGTTAGSPGVASGNLIEIPLNLPVNLCGNSLSVVGVLDSAFDNTCTNESGADSSSSASTTATGTAADSPGLLSGNLISIPVNAPANVCGNSLNVIGIGDSAHDNSCSNESGSGDSGSGAGTTTATGTAVGSPGVGSGNLISIPVNAPVNICGNTLSVIGIGNPAHDNSCSNEAGTGTSPTPPCGCTPPPPPPPCGCAPTPPKSTAPLTGPSGQTSSSISPTGTLASTGTGAMAVAPLGFGLLGGGTYLRRRSALKARGR